MKGKVYEFGPFSASEDEKVLRRGDRVVALTPKAFDILWTLAAANGRVLSKEALLSAVWPDTFVEEGNLTFNISILRKALTAEGADAGLIQTVPRRGYRLGVEVTEVAEGSPVLQPAAARPRPSRARMAGALAILALMASAAFVYSSARMPRIQSIAILPLKPIGAASAPEPLALGLADAIIAKLAGLNSLIVRPTASVARYETQDADPIGAGRALQVDAVLTGTIQRTPDRVRVAAQLYTVADSREVWADQFDTTARDLFGLEDSISERVASALRVNISASDREAMARHYTSDAEAHELYITGRYYCSRWGPESATTSRRYFEQAIAKDANYPLAYTGLAGSLGQIAHWGLLNPSQAHSLMRPAIDRAIELDPRLAEAHSTRGMDKLAFDWDGAAALRELDEAVRLGPNIANSHAMRAACLLALGRSDLAEREKALQLEPDSPLYTIGVGWSHYYTRDFRHAEPYYQMALAKDGSFAAAYWSLGESLEAEGRTAEAIAAFEKSALFTNRNPRAIAGLGHALGLAGRRQEALAILDELQKQAGARYVPAFFVSIVYLGMGDLDHTFEWLNRAVEERSDWLIFLGVSPMWDVARQDARYQAVVRKVGL
ncbi:MAG TPA: winged helix-turn-helix domain-containing protein [Candidatus Solibacter sp.]|nr:winged helix-turn-helix domain-containing protein [Candidatus Solibacter sp.]